MKCVLWAGLVVILLDVFTVGLRIHPIHQRSPPSSRGSFGKIFLLIDFLLSVIWQAVNKRKINVTWLGRGAVIVHEFR